MIDAIRKELEALPGISGWKICSHETEGMEAYLVRDTLEMPRAKSVRSADVSVYRDIRIDGTERRGSATAIIYPGSSREEIRETLSRTVNAAGYVSNPWYPLVRPSRRTTDGTPGPEESLSGSFEDLVPELIRPSAPGKGHIAYAELLLTREEQHILNSEGVDERYGRRNGYLEFASNWKEPGKEEVEIFESLQFSDTEQGLLAQFLDETLARTRDRCNAAPIPSVGKLPVVLSGVAVSEFFSWFLFHVTARNIYRKLSVAREGYPLQGESIHGDRVTLSIDPYLEGSPSNRPFDQDGLALEPHVLIEGGTVKRIAGDVQHAHYLGIEPTGQIGNYTVAAGNLLRADIEHETRLEITDFSDFQIDSLTGNFGGEIRLAYLCRGTRKEPVTGGSISGRMSEVMGTMRFSAEAARRENFKGPSFVRLENITVSGG